ncbi:MAG: class I SAM-dependent methyltransferase [Actinomycetota bacterium]
MPEDYGPSTYGDRIADVYDQWFSVPVDTDDAVAFLADQAGSGPALELGIGTGRLAIPLKERGVEIHGLDSSEAMVAKLREKPGGADIPVVMGDFADVRVEGRFRLIFVAFNTLFGLLSQDDQVRCFRNAAEHLTEDGVFVIQAFVPDLTRFDRGQRVQAEAVGTDSLVIGADEHDAVHQRVRSLHVVLTESETRLYPVRIRYAYPSELDLMARLAGLRLRNRWEDWTKTAFTPASPQHISVYGREP